MEVPALQVRFPETRVARAVAASACDAAAGCMAVDTHERAGDVAPRPPALQQAAERHYQAVRDTIVKWVDRADKALGELASDPRAEIRSLTEDMEACRKKVQQNVPDLQPQTFPLAKRQIHYAYKALQPRLEAVAAQHPGPVQERLKPVIQVLDRVQSAVFDTTWEFESRLEADGELSALLGDFPSRFYAVRPATDELTNFSEVSPQLYRGGQPLGDGFHWLAEHGVKSEINLRGELAGGVDATPWGDRIRYYEIPFPDNGNPTFEQVEQFLDLVDDPANQPAYVHCWGGMGRTGILAACYRIARQGWTPEQALREASFVRFRGDFHEEQARYIKDFEAYWCERHPSVEQAPP